MNIDVPKTPVKTEFRRRLPRRWVAAAGWAAIAAAVGAWSLARPIDVRRDGPASLPLAAVVALSSGVDSLATLDRAGGLGLESALALLAETGAASLVTTRVVDDGIPSDSAQALLVGAAGYSGPWRVLPLRDQTTRGEAVALAGAMPSRGHIAVVTSPSHSGRACAAFEHVGFTVSCRPVAGEPDAYASAYERLARLKYRWKGWIR